MPSKHYDLDTNKNLGGNSASDVYIPSQKAVKEYVDKTVTDATKEQSKTKIIFRSW